MKVKNVHVSRLPKKISAATLFVLSSVNSIKDSWIGVCLTHQTQQLMGSTNNTIGNK